MMKEIELNFAILSSGDEFSLWYDSTDEVLELSCLVTEFYDWEKNNSWKQNTTIRKIVIDKVSQCNICFERGKLDELLTFNFLKVTDKKIARTGRYFSGVYMNECQKKAIICIGDAYIYLESKFPLTFSLMKLSEEEFKNTLKMKRQWDESLMKTHDSWCE